MIFPLKHTHVSREIKIILLMISFASVLLALNVFILHTINKEAPLLQFVSKPKDQKVMFKVQSIDTMKYSRDRAGQFLEDPSSHQAFVDKQMELIAAAGATHVAIDTPYDEKFLPVLTLWVNSARAHHLLVFFRGNFSGWEGWYGYAKISRDDHERLLTKFIRSNASLFVPDDIFTPCTECENGGPGDPRQTGDTEGYNTFLVEEKKIADAEFSNIRRQVTVYTSMNADIARYVITPSVAHDLGGTILIDHYTTSTEQFSGDVKMLGELLHANIGIGEFGTPIPDLNGVMSDTEQAKFVQDTLDGLYQGTGVVPLMNYWVLKGGSTALINDDDTLRSSYRILSSFYKAPYLYGTISNSLGEPVIGTTMVIGSTTKRIVRDNAYNLYLPEFYRSITVTKPGYKDVTLRLPAVLATSSRRDIYLSPTQPTFFYNMKLLIRKLSGKQNAGYSSK